MIGTSVVWEVEDVSSFAYKQFGCLFYFDVMMTFSYFDDRKPGERQGQPATSSSLLGDLNSLIRKWTN